MAFFGFQPTDLEADKSSFAEPPIEEYTWGSEKYDNLGDALQEGNDELNDETFGSADKVGKDFDFTKQSSSPAPAVEPKPILPARGTHQSLESIWDDRSPFSVLPRSKDNITPIPLNRGVSHTGPPPGVRTLQEIESEMRLTTEQTRIQALRQQEQHQYEREQQHQRQQLEYEQRQREMELQQRQDQQRYQAHQAQLRDLQAQNMHQRTPPPRMQEQRMGGIPQQRQIQIQRQHQEMQQDQRLRELQDQLRLEDIERQLRAQQLSQGPYTHQRQPSGPSTAELQAARSHLLLQQRRESPALSQSIQIQQRLLADMAQSELMMQGASPEQQAALREEAMRKIVEAERMEEKRRRRAAKIAHMARYNDLMTQSDKDFITRIQVSQLVTQDPYAEDFYAQVFGAIQRSRMGLQAHDERVLKFGSGGGVGLGLPQKGGPNRRPSAMQRMEAQVERIVSNARMREKEKGMHSIHSLQGALGKTSGRSYKAAPRQLLNVDDSASDAEVREKAAQAATKLGLETLGNAANTDGLVRANAMTTREVLVHLENLYDLVLDIEQLRRDQPHQEDEEACIEWDQAYASIAEQLFDGTKVMTPLETSNPHPFISLLWPTKGKKILPRLTRHLSSQQMYTMLTLLVACFSQLDVVKNAPLLDSLEDTRERREVEIQTQAFLGSVLQTILPIIAKASLRLISGLLGLLLDRSNIVAVAQSRPGMALLTLFLTRVEVMKENVQTGADPADAPTEEEEMAWETMFHHLCELLAPHFTLLFPSTRLAPMLPPQVPPSKATDILDQPVWQFFAAVALNSSEDQHRVLVTTLRSKILENVQAAHMGWVVDEEGRQLKLANVDIFLHAVGIDSSKINI